MKNRKSPRREPRANTLTNVATIAPDVGSVNPGITIEALPPISFVPHYCAPPQEIPVELLPELLTGRVMYDLVLPLRRKYHEVRTLHGLEAAKTAIREPKSHLPAILACGVFGARCVAGLEKYSGIVPDDFDSFESRREAENFKARLAQDPHVLLAFISPSGFGVKALLVYRPATGIATTGTWPHVTASKNLATPSTAAAKT